MPRHPWWAAVLPLALALALAVASTPAAMASGAGRPNFVILFVDDLGYNEINLGAAAPAAGGYSGYNGSVQTPHLAEFAQEGMVFTSWYSAWHCCSASRAAMLTGRLPPRTGVDASGSGVFTAMAIGGKCCARAARSAH